MNIPTGSQPGVLRQIMDSEFIATDKSLGQHSGLLAGGEAGRKIEYSSLCANKATNEIVDANDSLLFQKPSRGHQFKPEQEAEQEAEKAQDKGVFMDPSIVRMVTLQDEINAFETFFDSWPRDSFLNHKVFATPNHNCNRMGLFGDLLQEQTATSQMAMLRKRSPELYTEIYRRLIGRDDEKFAMVC